MAKALKIASVGPVMVTIRSGQFPSEMLIRAPLYRSKKRNRKYMIMRQKCLFGVLIFAEKFYSRLHAFSSPFLLSGSKDKEHY